MKFSICCERQTALTPYPAERQAGIHSTSTLLDGRLPRRWPTPGPWTVRHAFTEEGSEFVKRVQGQHVGDVLAAHHVAHGAEFAERHQ
jgi:hypothetical protein